MVLGFAVVTIGGQTLPRPRIWKIFRQQCSVIALREVSKNFGKNDETLITVPSGRGGGMAEKLSFPLEPEISFQTSTGLPNVQKLSQQAKSVLQQKFFH